MSDTPASRPLVLWLIPVFLALHNAEEALTFPSYLPYIATRVPVRLPPDAYSRLLIALAIVTVIPFVVAAWMYARPRLRVALWILLLIQAVVFVNVISHAVVAAFVLRGYGPGLLTALAVNLPFSIYLLRRTVRERWLSTRALVLLVPSALVVHGPILVGLMVAAGVFARPG